MIDTFKEFLASRVSKFPKYLTLLIIQYLLMASALQYYAEAPKVNELLTALTPSLIIIYFAVFAVFYLYFYYNSGKSESPKTSIILTVLGGLMVFFWFGYVFIYNSTIPEEAITLLSISITAVLAICWWIIRNEQSKLASKKNHTLNILLQSRLSAIYQEKLADAGLVYPDGCQIPNLSLLETDEEKTMHSNLMAFSSMMINVSQQVKLPNGEQIIVNEELAQKARAIKAIGYLLNYFEFLAVGIKKDDIHEPLIKDCLFGIVKSLRFTAAHLIKEKRDRDIGTWSNFAEMCDRWCGPLDQDK